MRNKRYPDLVGFAQLLGGNKSAVDVVAPKLHLFALCRIQGVGAFDGGPLSLTNVRPRVSMLGLFEKVLKDDLAGGATDELETSVVLTDCALVASFE